MSELDDTLSSAISELAVLQQNMARLTRENTELKVLLIDAVRQMKDVEAILLRALDKDH